MVIIFLHRLPGCEWVRTLSPPPLRVCLGMSWAELHPSWNFFLQRTRFKIRPPKRSNLSKSYSVFMIVGVVLSTPNLHLQHLQGERHYILSKRLPVIMSQKHVVFVRAVWQLLMPEGKGVSVPPCNLSLNPEYTDSISSENRQPLKLYEAKVERIVTSWL